MPWIDVTLPLRADYPAWPGDTPFQRSIRASTDRSGYNLSSLCCSAHFGTHVDAPYHFRDDGKRVDELDLELLVGRCRVVEVERLKGNITVNDLAQRVSPGTTRLLVKTANSCRLQDRKFHPDYIAFTPAAISWLLGLGVKLLGIDYYSIGSPDPEGEAVHRLFFSGNDTVALEGVDLSRVTPGDYRLICLPLKVSGGDGAPARVLLGTAGSERDFS